MSKQKKKSSKNKGFIRKFLLICIIVGGLGYMFFYLRLNGNIYINQKVVIKKGDDINKIYSYFSGGDVLFLKLYMKMNNIDKINIVPGVYEFTGTYSKPTFLDLLQSGPADKSFRLTILEGNNIYDVDQKLSNIDLISKGDYITLATDKEIIDKYRKKYDFLKYLPEDVNNLEGFLYPDTYELPSDGNISDRLIYLQLEAFKSKVWDKYKDQFLNFSQKLNDNGYKLKLGAYNIIKLASVIEKEEKTSENKPVIAGIFINRLENNWRLDADISLCYGLAKSTSDCAGLISSNVNDKTNKYNTRAVKGLTPTPIGNPSVDTIVGLLNFKKSDYFFYLHGSDGGFYPARTNDEHNYNKQKYLNN